MTDSIQYMERTRLYYEAQGYDRAYQWAHHDTTPFHKPAKPLTASRVALVTTAIHPLDVDTPMIGRKANAFPMGDVPDQFFTDDLSWDKSTTHTDDVGSFFPHEALQALADEGQIGSVNERFFYVPTEYSQRNTLEKDGPFVVEECLKDDVDLAILIPL